MVECWNENGTQILYHTQKKNTLIKKSKLNEISTWAVKTSREENEENLFIGRGKNEIMKHCWRKTEKSTNTVHTHTLIKGHSGHLPVTVNSVVVLASPVWNLTEESYDFLFSFSRVFFFFVFAWRHNNNNKKKRTGTRIITIYEHWVELKIRSETRTLTEWNKNNTKTNRKKKLNKTWKHTNIVYKHKTNEINTVDKALLNLWTWNGIY